MFVCSKLLYKRGQNDIYLGAHDPCWALTSGVTLKFFTVTIGQGRESFWRSPEISELVNKLYINVQKVGHNWNISYTKWVIWMYFTKPTLHGEEKYDVTTLDKLSSSEIFFHYGIFIAPKNTHIYGLITNDDSSSIVSRIVPNTDICYNKIWLLGLSKLHLIITLILSLLQCCL